MPVPAPVTRATRPDSSLLAIPSGMVQNGMTPRAAPLPQPWSPEDEAGIRRWMHPEGTHDPPVLFQILQRHPVLAKRTQALGQELYLGGRLEPRDRQIAIMRMCALVGCAYEWGGQATFWGPRVGLTE